MSSCDESPLTGLLASRVAKSRKRPRYSTPWNRHHCPHYNQSLTLKTFKRHQKLFCRSDGTWIADIEEDDAGSTEGEDMCDIT